MVQRAEVGQLAWGNQHTTGVHAHVTCHAFELLRQLQQGFDFIFFGQTLGQDGLHLNRTGDGDVLTGLVRNQATDALAKGVAHVEHTAHVTNRGTRRHGAEGGNLRHGIAAVFVFHVVNHAVAVGLAKVNVKVGHGYPLWVQETLEQQVVLQRVKVGNLQGIRHERARTRTTTWAHRATIGFGPLDEVTHDQEVAGKAHVQNRVQLKLKAIHITWTLFVAFGLHGVQVRQAGF